MRNAFGTARTCGINLAPAPGTGWLGHAARAAPAAKPRVAADGSNDASAWAQRMCVAGHDISWPARVLVFSQPYLESRLVLVGRRGADVSAKTLSDLTGKRVAIVEGYSYGGAVDLGGPVFVRSRSEEDSLSQLLSGDVEYTLMDDLVVQDILNNYPKESEARLQIGATPLVRRDLHLAIRARGPRHRPSPVLPRWLDLRGLGERARELQRHQPEVSGSAEIDW
jgi:hypothetical protein